MFRAGVLLTSSIRIAKRKRRVVKDRVSSSVFPLFILLQESFPLLLQQGSISLLLLQKSFSLLFLQEQRPLYLLIISQTLEAPVIQDSTDNHGLDKPIWTDGSDEDLLGDLRQGEFGNAISYWQEIGEHGKSRHHDDVWQGQTKQIFAKLPARFPDVHQITRDDEKGRHHERENACL